MKSPTFGKIEETLTYQTRYAAYIIVSKPENNTMVLVQAPNGAYFLPGGEIEGTETKEEAIHREVLEELGISVEIGHYLGKPMNIFIRTIDKLPIITLDIFM